MDEQVFRKTSEAAIDALKKDLYAAEVSGDFEVEEQHGVLNVVFEEPPGKFVITPNAPVRQIWISALATSFKLDWNGERFVLARTGEGLKELVERLVREHLAAA